MDTRNPWKGNTLDVWEERRSGNNRSRSKDFRSSYERDYARIIHSAAFRRLQNKTQVLGLGESDFYRTRLTHSIEVAQIGAGITEKLKKDMGKETQQENTQEIDSILPCDRLIQTICLAHDIGNPPFGHGGEIALNELMWELGGFEGNGQTLRILSKLEKYSESYGMDVTRRTLLGIIKYPCNYSLLCNDSRYKKNNEFKPPKCYLDDENDVFQWITNPFSSSDKQLFQEYKKPYSPSDKKHFHGKTKFKSLDTSIMELADDISYGVHDLEDAISMGLIKLEHWNEHINGLEDFDIGENKKIFRIRTNLFSNEKYKIKDSIGDLVNYFITNVGIKIVQNSEGIFATPLLKYNVFLPPQPLKILHSLHDIVRSQVIDDPKVQLLEFKGQQVVKQLFEVFASDPKRFLPKTTLARYEKDNKKIRVICDYISGMTDEYATKLYQTVFMPQCGSIFERL